MIMTTIITMRTEDHHTQITPMIILIQITRRTKSSKQTNSKYVNVRDLDNKQVFHIVLPPFLYQNVSIWLI